MSTLGVRIKYLREQNNLSMQQLADEVHTYKGTISKYEKGTNEPAISTLIAISRFFHVSLDWLLLGEELLNSNCENSVLPPDEHELLHEFRVLSPSARKEVVAFTKLKASFDFMAETPSTSMSGDGSITDNKVG